MSIILPYKGISPTIDKTAFIAPNAAVAGDVHIGAEAGIWFSVSIRGDVNEVRIGARTNIQDNSVIHCTYKGEGTYIGDDVTVGHAAVLHACTLEDFSFVGMQACVMDGAIVESKAMLAAGALLTPGKRVPSGQLWAGSPARYVRPLTEDELKHIEWSSGHYVRLAGEYRENL